MKYRNWQIPYTAPQPPEALLRAGYSPLLAVLLAAASYLWARDANPVEGAAHPWLGIGLMPVMFLGPVVAVASLITTLLV